MSLKDRPIGFFDSGVGGLSVLKEAIKIMPKEHFVYYGDSANAPYGTKSIEEIHRLSKGAADFLAKKNIKAMVVACNTATSVAINYLRENYKDMPVIGIEPALKPAVNLKNKGRILIMATPITLAEKKFNDLMNKYKHVAIIDPLPCPGLAELIETGKIDSSEIENYVEQKLNKYKNEEIASIVLGCTHYPFISHKIREILGKEVHIIDGGLGTAKQLKRKLDEKNLLNKDGCGKVEIYNSLSEEAINLSYELLNK